MYATDMTISSRLQVPLARRPRKSASRTLDSAKTVATLSNGLAIVSTRPAAATVAVRDEDTAGVLLPKLGAALSRPGLPRESVFTGAASVFAYSVDLDDPAILVREAADGSRVRGRMVRAKFIPDSGPSSG